jgi:hypothetical protein
LKVATLISADLSVGSFKMAALTLLVMTVSSTYSPVPSYVRVEAQPSAMATNRMPASVANLRVMFFMSFPLNEIPRRHCAGLQTPHQE